MEHDPPTPGQGNRPWVGLMEAFLALLDTEPFESLPGAVCRLFLDDPWFQSEVQRRVGWAIGSQALPHGCGPDLEQELLAMFISKVHHAPDLRINRTMAPATFGGWIGKILDHLSTDAAKSIKRRYEMHAGPLPELSATQERLELTIDVRALVDAQPPEIKNVLLLYDSGYSLAKVAELLDESYWRVYELFRKGIRDIRRRLDIKEPQPRRRRGGRGPAPSE